MTKEQFDRARVIVHEISHLAIYRDSLSKTGQVFFMDGEERAGSWQLNEDSGRPLVEFRDQQITSLNTRIAGLQAEFDAL